MTDSNTPNAHDLLLHEHDARGVHRLTLNNPGSFNTLSEAMLTALQKALDAIAQDEQARVVVLGAAGKAFCAGHNLKEMRAQPELAYYQKLFAQCTRMMMALRKLPVPVIAPLKVTTRPVEATFSVRSMLVPKATGPVRRRSVLPPCPKNASAA